MTGVIAPLNDLAYRVHRQAVVKGFWDSERDMAKCSCSRCLSCRRRWRSTGAGRPAVWSDGGKPEGFAAELVDCIIRCLDTLSSFGVDIDGIFNRKLAYNATRPHKHGKGC